MSTKDPNMKVIFGSDTKDFEKGASAVKQGLKDLDKSSESMLTSLSDAFGVPSAKVEQMTSAIRGLGYKLVETGNEGAKAFGSILAKIGPLQAGIAGLGIGAAVAGFKQLKAEADNFKSTIDGMNLSMATAAYISTYKQVLHDVNSETGKQVAEAMDKWERGFGRFKANIGATFVTTVGGESKWYDALLPTGLVRGWKEATAAADQAAAAADRNAERADQMADLMKEQLTLNNELKLVEREIAEARRVASDKTASAAERAAAEAELRQKINENYDRQYDLQSRMLALQRGMDDEAANTFEDTKKTLEMEGALIDIETARQNELRAIDKLSASIAASTSKTASASAQAKAEAEAAAAVYSKWAAMASSMSAPNTAGAPNTVVGPSLSILPQKEDTEMFKQTFLAQMGDIKVGIGLEVDAKTIQDITGEINSLLKDSVTNASMIIGNLVGTLAAGGDAWGNFKNAAVSAFGDMAISVGKVAISAGVATLGIKAALESLNGYVAIAAGAALVALGAAVKSSLSSVANGNYSAGAGAYSSGYSGGGSYGNEGFATREITVNVTGTLEGDGDKLLAVINGANRRRTINT